MDSRISLINRLKIQLKGYVHIGDEKPDGWRKELSIYAFRCPKHDIVYDYPHGYEGRLECPICREEMKRERKTEFAHTELNPQDVIEVSNVESETLYH